MKVKLFIILIFFSIKGIAQDPILSVTKTYFRAHPFDMKFSNFIRSLQADPWFTIENYERRTDSSFFYLSGTYKNFNPFKFEPTEIRLVIAENEMLYEDSLQSRDTVINLQLIGTTDTGETGFKQVEKEYKRFNNNQSRKFYDNHYSNIQKNGVIEAEIMNYFVFPFTISPITAAWGKMTASQKFVFTITIRFIVKENVAELIEGHY